MEINRSLVRWSTSKAVVHSITFTRASSRKISINDAIELEPLPVKHIAAQAEDQKQTKELSWQANQNHQLMLESISD